MAFSPNGKCLASGSADTTVKLWAMDTNKEKATLKGHTGYLWSVAFSPDGTRLGSGSLDRCVKLWDVATGTEQNSMKAKVVMGVAFSPDGKILAAGSSDSLGGTVRLWDLARKDADK